MNLSRVARRSPRHMSGTGLPRALSALLLLLSPIAADATHGGPPSYPRVMTYTNSLGGFSDERMDTLSWHDLLTTQAGPEDIADLRARNPYMRILYNTMPQHASGWGTPGDSTWYPDTLHSLKSLCKYYVIQNDWYLYDIHGAPIAEWEEGGYAVNWTRYCPRGTYGTSRGMNYVEWYVNVALPQIAYHSPAWAEPWGWGLILLRWDRLGDPGRLPAVLESRAIRDCRSRSRR